MSNLQPAENENGLIISEEVIAKIASTASLEIKGVSGMAPAAPDIKDIFNKELKGKAVKLLERDNELAIDVYISVDLGARIPDTALEVQKSVKEAVQNMTGKTVSRVNVHVADLNLKATEAAPTPAQ